MCIHHSAFHTLLTIVPILKTYVKQGGAGTWSDGKLVTRIGRNNNSVLTVSIALTVISI